MQTCCTNKRDKLRVFCIVVCAEQGSLIIIRGLARVRERVRKKKGSISSLEKKIQLCFLGKGFDRLLERRVWLDFLRSMSD